MAKALRVRSLGCADHSSVMVHACTSRPLSPNVKQDEATAEVRQKEQPWQVLLGMLSGQEEEAGEAVQQPRAELESERAAKDAALVAQQAALVAQQAALVAKQAALTAEQEERVAKEAALTAEQEERVAKEAALAEVAAMRERLRALEGAPVEEGEPAV